MEPLWLTHVKADYVDAKNSALGPCVLLLLPMLGLLVYFCSPSKAPAIMLEMGLCALALTPGLIIKRNGLSWAECLHLYATPFFALAHARNRVRLTRYDCSYPNRFRVAVESPDTALKSLAVLTLSTAPSHLKALIPRSTLAHLLATLDPSGRQLVFQALRPAPMAKQLD